MAGLHTVIVVDANGCQAVATVIISEPPAIAAYAEVMNHVSCAGASDGSARINVTGGAPPYSFDWGNGSGMCNCPVKTNLSAGLYHVKVTDANGCTVIVLVVITEPLPLVANAGIMKEVSCVGGNDGAILVGAIGGTPPYSYRWSNGSTNALLTGVPAGYYTVTVTDARGCEAEDAVTLEATPVAT
jgi:hypothetical protein